ncbi:DNA internalization-related competence protein ComEC/Rec2, partial [Neisseria sp. P0022.S010]
QGLVLAWQWPVGEVADKVVRVEVVDMPRDDVRRVKFAARAWDDRGQAFDLMLSDYQRRDGMVGSRWSVSARVRPVIGEVNVRGLNRETGALANGIDGMGTVGRDRKLVRQGGGFGVANMCEAVSRSWQGTADKYPEVSDGIGLMRALS